MADDPYLDSGRKILSGSDDDQSSAPSDASAAPDPYLAHGQQVLAATPATSSAAPSSDSGQIPMLHNFVAGLRQGARDIVSTGAQLGDWVDERVPILKWIDEHNPLMGNEDLQAERKAYEASPEGQSYSGGAGRFVGQTVATAPLLGPVAKGVGTVVSALTPEMSAAVPWVARTVAPWLARTTAEGATVGGTFGGLTSSASDQPVGQSIAQGAETGAVAGPVISLAVKGVPVLGKGVSSTFNYLTGRSPGLAVEQAMTEARARAGASAEATSPQSPPPPAASTQAAPAPATPVTPAPEAAPTTGGPQPGGAAVTPQTTLAANAPSRSQDLAGKVDYIDQMLQDRPNIGRADFNEYVKGNTPTQAEGLGDANLAAVQRQVEPGSQAYANKRSLAVDNRLDHFDNQAGTATMLDNKERELADWDQKTLAPVWANKTPVDASGLLSDVDARLSSPTAQIGPVEDALNEVRSRLFKRGTDQLQDDPQMLYGARRQISYMLSKAGRQANPAYGNDDVMRELIGVRDQLDNTIEPGAPGFGAWRAGHAAQASDIDRMDVLQTMRQQILGQNGDIQLSRLTTALKGLRNRMDQGGANPAQSLNLDDLEMLRNLRQDLLREGNKSLAMPVGSPTAANLDVGAQTGLNAATAGAHYVAAHVPGGNLLLDAGLTKRALANSAKSKMLWERNLLAPP